MCYTSYISEQELRDLLKEGKTLYQISRQFNTTIPEIFKLGRSYGISFAYDHNRIPRPTKQDLESMYTDEGMTQKQIASEFGVTQSTVYVWFREYHIPTRGSHCHEQTFGHEYQYIVKYEDIVLRDRCIGDYY